MNHQVDRDLVLQVRKGNNEAYAEIVRRYLSSVFNVCYRLMGERREAEDLTQETFIRAYQHLGRYDLERPFGAWIRRVAANLCINRYQLHHNDGLPLDEERESPLVGSSNTPEGLMVQKQEAEKVRAAILSLPPVYRVVIELRHFQELSYVEIADQLEMPLSDVKSHLFRARRKLAEKLRQYV